MTDSHNLPRLLPTANASGKKNAHLHEIFRPSLAVERKNGEFRGGDLDPTLRPSLIQLSPSRFNMTGLSELLLHLQREEEAGRD